MKKIALFFAFVVCVLSTLPSCSSAYNLPGGSGHNSGPHIADRGRCGLDKHRTKRPKGSKVKYSKTKKNKKSPPKKHKKNNSKKQKKHHR